MGEELGFIIEEIRAEFPDCIARRQVDKGWERVANHLIVEFEGIGRVTTDISGRHKTFRSAHGEVKDFFRSHRLQPGDKMEIIRLAKYEYQIRPASAG